MTRAFPSSPSACSLVSSAASVWVWAVVLPLLFGCDSCGSDAAESPSDNETASSGSSVEARPVGTVEGVVRFAEGAELPTYPGNDWSLRGDLPEVCPSRNDQPYHPVTLGEGRGLVGMLVAAHGFVEADVPAPEPTVRELTIRNCDLTPKLVVGVRGDTLRITNEDDYPFLPAMPGTSQYRGLLQGQSRDIPLEEGNVFAIECAFAAPCGRSDIVVSYHPVFDVTEDGGRYRIENVPADVDLSIHAYHPLFADASAELRVGAGETVQRDLVVGATAPAPAEEPEEEGAPDEPSATEDEEPGATEGPAENQPGLF